MTVAAQLPTCLLQARCVHCGQLGGAGEQLGGGGMMVGFALACQREALCKLQLPKPIKRCLTVQG